MSVVRVILPYALIVCLVLVGTWLIMLGMAFIPALIERDWQAVASRAAFFASGVGMWIIADMIERKVRQE